MYNHGYSSLPSNIKYPAAIPCGMYWNVLDRIYSWLGVPNIGYYLIFGGIHILLTILDIYFVWCCVCCLLSIGGPNTNKKRQWDMSLVIELVVIQMFQLAVVTWLWFNLPWCHKPRIRASPNTNQERDTGAVDQQNLSMAINVAYIPNLALTGCIGGAWGLRGSFCFLSDRPWSEAKQKVPWPWRSHASSMPPMCPRSRGAGAPASSERSTSCSLWAPRRSSDVPVHLPPIWIYLPTGLRWEKNKQVNPRFFAIFHMEVFMKLSFTFAIFGTSAIFGFQPPCAMRTMNRTCSWARAEPRALRYLTSTSAELTIDHVFFSLGMVNPLKIPQLGFTSPNIATTKKIKTT